MKIFKNLIFDPDFRRRPAWTDRILYRVNEYNYEDLGQDVILSLIVKDFKSITDPQYRCSDHRPVAASLEMSVFSRELAVSKKLMAFDPVIHFQRMHTAWFVNEDGKFSYLIDRNAGQLLDNWDWIGLYHVSSVIRKSYF